LKAKDAFVGLDDTQYEGRAYDGFYTLVKIDPRFFEEDPTKELYSLTLRGNNELLVKMPAWDYDLMNERDDLVAAIAKSKRSKGKSIDDKLLDAVDNATDGADESDARSFVILNLQFSGGVHLSGEVLYNGKQFIKTSQIPTERRVKFQKSGNVFLYWKIARLDTESQKRGRKPKKTKQSEAAVAAASSSDEGEGVDEDDEDMYG